MKVSLFHKLVLRPTKATIVTILLFINIGVAIATLIGAYGGYVNPGRFVYPALVSMMLPVILVVGAVVLIIDLLVKKRFSWIIVITWVLSLPSLQIYSPLNVKSDVIDEEEKERSFTFMTFNVLHFWDFRGDVPGLERNTTIDYILDMDADIVNLQEVDFIKSWPLWHITPEQVKELDQKYPYRMVNVNNELTLLSKYPFTLDDMPMPSPMNIKMALFNLRIKGHLVRLFNVHLESIGLSLADKELYQSLFEKAPNSERQLKKELRDVKHQLIDKLAIAFEKRVEQARFIRNTIDSIGGDFIVAGDFNDIQGSYAVREILGDDMRDAYAENAFGPTITYHGNRFYFRIDHILYGGDMSAVGIERGDIKSSDHYPLFTTFVFENQ